ncbi:uncharacterized protein LOC133632325 isoform X2 [Entelurus aequoreus]|uniref:uncharacterized protein LOC133632325 isoform X2 n=1 Tax=Entelurus aequoreus TaxID=161455 RepID=UPI002B1DDD76|nr:uncharacterized protein LOC133632325 isoform X2 [Entelurus aequoreus]
MGREKRSKAWLHFTKKHQEDTATCKYCRASLSCKGGSTSNMLKHVRALHYRKLRETRRVFDTRRGSDKDGEARPSSSVSTCSPTRTWTRRSAKSDVAERGDSHLREIRPAPSNLKADVWQYFGFYDVPDGSRLDKSHCICKVCRCKIKYLGNTSNMRSHVTRFHLAEAAGRRRDTTGDPTNADHTTLEDAIKSEPEDPNDDPEERPDAEEPAVRMEETVESSRLTPSPSYVDASPPASQRSPATDSFELLNERPRPRGRWSEVERFIASMERIQSVLVEQLRQSQERQERLVNNPPQSNQSMVAALLQGIQSLRPQPPTTRPPTVKEEEEELWITQEGDYLVEPGLTRAPLGAAASVKNEDHEEKPPRVLPAPSRSE